MLSLNAHAQCRVAQCPERRADWPDDWPYFLSSYVHVLPLPVLHSSAASAASPGISASFLLTFSLFESFFLPSGKLTIVRCICFYALIPSLLCVCVYAGMWGHDMPLELTKLFVCDTFDILLSAGTRKEPWQPVLTSLRSTQLLWLILGTSNVRNCARREIS